MLTEALGDDFEASALKLCRQENLIKLLHSGNKILAEVGHLVVLGIVHNVCSLKLIANLSSEMAASRSSAVHARMAAYLFFFLTVYPVEYLERSKSVI